MEWIVQLPLFFFSVIVHELSKGWAAAARGDPSAQRHGRLTLNPLPHIDAFGTVFLPLLCFALKRPMFGWAKPVPVDAATLGRARTIEVTAAGPASHLVLAIVLAILFKLSSMLRLFAPEFERTLQDALLFGVSLNLLLAFFNLLPVHPLDGSRLIAGLMPQQWRERYERLAPYAASVLALLLAGRWLDPFLLGPAHALLSLLARAGLVS